MVFLHTIGVLAVAFAPGTAIGFERQWRQRNAWLRTTVLVAVGACAFRPWDAAVSVTPAP